AAPLQPPPPPLSVPTTTCATGPLTRGAKIVAAEPKWGAAFAPGNAIAAAPKACAFAYAADEIRKFRRGPKKTCAFAYATGRAPSTARGLKKLCALFNAAGLSVSRSTG